MPTQETRLVPRPSLPISPGANRSVVLLIVLAAALSVMTGCATDPQALARWSNQRDVVVSAGEYRLAPPDTITIHSPVSPEVDGSRHQIRPDGKVALRLLGEVHVAGLTTEEAADKIGRHLARFYQNPEVVIDIAAYRSKFYYVFGEVGHAGPKPYTGRDTLIKALADARLNNFAWRSQIRITRPGPDANSRATVIVDLNKMLKGETEHDVLLQEGDIIEVPPTPLAWVGHQVRQVLYPVDPIIDAYNTPARFMESQDTYNDEDRR